MNRREKQMLLRIGRASRGTPEMSRLQRLRSVKADSAYQCIADMEHALVGVVKHTMGVTPQQRDTAHVILARFYELMRDNGIDLERDFRNEGR